MKKATYRPSKVRTIGFILIAAAGFLVFVDAASPNVQAQLTNSPHLDSLSQLKARTTRIQDSTNTNQNNVEKARPQQVAAANSSRRLAGIDPNRDRTETEDTEVVVHGQSASDAGASLGRTAKSLAREVQHNRENDYADQIREPVQTKPKVHHEAETTHRYYQYQDVQAPAVKRVAPEEHHQYIDHHTTTPQTSYYAKTQEKNSVKHYHQADKAKYKNVPHGEVQQAVVTYHQQPTYVAANHVEKVAVPKELPSTGPGIATVVSLVGVISALLARKIFIR